MIEELSGREPAEHVPGAVPLTRPVPARISFLAAHSRSSMRGTITQTEASTEATSSTAARRTFRSSGAPATNGQTSSESALGSRFQNAARR